MGPLGAVAQALLFSHLLSSPPWPGICWEIPYETTKSVQGSSESWTLAELRVTSVVVLCF